MLSIGAFIGKVRPTKVIILLLSSLVVYLLYYESSSKSQIGLSPQRPLLRRDHHQQQIQTNGIIVDEMLPGSSRLPLNSSSSKIKKGTGIPVPPRTNNRPKTVKVKGDQQKAYHVDKVKAVASSHDEIPDPVIRSDSSHHAHHGVKTVNKQKDEIKTSLSLSRPRPTTIIEKGQPSRPSALNIVIPFSNVKKNELLKPKLKTMMTSLLLYTTMPLNIYYFGDDESFESAWAITTENEYYKRHEHKILRLSSRATVEEKLSEIKQPLERFFNYKKQVYFSDILFFLSLIIGELLPNISEVVMLDVDLMFRNDIKLLYKYFEEFNMDTIFGMAYEQQPVYRHVFYKFRDRNPRTKVGGPPPDGQTGYNSGVLLINLRNMRNSSLYKNVIKPDKIEKLTKQYMFQGHLGDQDLLTLISLQHENLFFTLPCTWNRQLCLWWKDKGYEGIFDKYHKCEGHINVYHGNCNTPFPGRNS